MVKVLVLIEWKCEKSKSYAGIKGTLVYMTTHEGPCFVASFSCHYYACFHEEMHCWRYICLVFSFCMKYERTLIHFLFQLSPTFFKALFSVCFFLPHRRTWFLFFSCLVVVTLGLLPGLTFCRRI